MLKFCRFRKNGPFADRFDEINKQLVCIETPVTGRRREPVLLMILQKLADYSKFLAGSGVTGTQAASLQ